MPERSPHRPYGKWPDHAIDMLLSLAVLILAVAFGLEVLGLL
jgi:hypothetical protein